MTLTMPQMQIEAAFGNGPFDASPTWTDITPWVQQVSTKRGRQHELQRFEAGTMTLTLNNRDGRFSQWNTSGPYTGKLVPSTPVKFTATWPRTGGTTFPVFYGFVDSWTPQYGAVKGEMVIAATDAMQLLSLAYLDQTAYNTQIIADAPYAWFVLDEPNSSPFVSDSISGYQAASVGFVDLGVPGPLLGGSPSAAEFAEFGYLQPAIPFAVTDTTLSFECWIQTTTMGTSFVGCNLFKGYTDGALGVVTVKYNTTTLTGTTNVCDGDWHHIVITWSGGGSGTQKLYVDGLVQASASYSNIVPFLFPGYIGADNFLNGGPENGFIGQIGEVAYYSTTLSASQVTLHFQLGSAGWATPQFSGQRITSVLALYGWPTGLESIATGLTQVQAATSSFAQSTALSYIQQVEATEQGQFFVSENGTITYLDRHYILTNAAAATSNGTFASDNNSGHFHYLQGSIVPAADDLDLWTDVLGSRQGGVNQQATNVTNAKKYGWRSLTGFTGLLQQDDNDVLALCQWLLAHYGTPISRVRQMAMDNTSQAGANFPQMLGRKLMDRVTVDWLPLDGTTVHFIQDSLVESIQHDVTQDSWKTTWGLSPAETQTYLILNDTTKGKMDSTNLLGY